MEKLYLLSNNGKKRRIYNISKNSPNVNIFKHEKIRKTEINHLIECGTTCNEDFQVNNTQVNPKANWQTIHRNIIGGIDSYFKNTYKLFSEKKDNLVLNQHGVKFKENNFEQEKLFFSDCKIPTKVSDSNYCSKYLSPFGTQLIKYNTYYYKNPFNAFNLFDHESLYINQNSTLPIFSEFILLMSNLLGKQRNYCLIDYVRKESNIVRFFPRYLIYGPQLLNQVLNFPFIIDKQLSLTSFDHPLHISSPINHLAPSCNKCLLPGFHPITAWLLPPSYFAKGGRLKKCSGFLDGMPINLFDTCFSIKNILTVESTYLFASSLNKEELEYYKKENFFLIEEKCKESIYYFDDNKQNIGIENEEELTLSNKIFYEQSEFARKVDYSDQNSIFCGFVSIESACEKYFGIGHERKNANLEYNLKQGLKINSNSPVNTIKIMNMNEKVFPNLISDCDVFLKCNYNFFKYLCKHKQPNMIEEKISLLIPRIRCIIKESRSLDSSITIFKPCYLLLWSYNVRNCSNTTKDINWINIQCRFMRLKFFGQAYETSIPINVNPHMEIILDQLNRIRNVDEARVFAWMLAGCMQYTINELLVDPHTRSLFFRNKCLRITDETNYFKSCINSGPFSGFPDSPLDSNGKIKWGLLKELVEI